MKFGVVMPPWPGRTARVAKLAEDMGFDCVLFPDSQNLAPEVWGQLMLAAAGTSRVLLGPGVTNSITRDAAVTASAAIALQIESNGRAVIGIGRGDSSVQRIGKDSDPVARFEVYLGRLQAYLRGESVDRDGFASKLEWLAAVPAAAKVPVEVAATGRRVIELAARVADRIAFAVGADLAHLAAAIEIARTAARAAGRADGDLALGAYVNCVANPDPTVARAAVRGTAATFARFSAMRGSRLEALPAPLRSAAEHLRAHYDMREHTRASAEHARALEDSFVDWFAIAGPVQIVQERLGKIASLGLDFCHLVTGSPETPREVTTTSLGLLARDILPKLGSAGAASRGSGAA